jgi:hypothetical protein
LSEFVTQRARPSVARLSSLPVIPVLTFLLLLIAAYSSRSSSSTEIALWVVFLSAILSNIAGFAFSPIAGAILFYVNPDPVETVQTLLVASIAQQVYCVWQLRSRILSFEFLPYLAGSFATLPIGILLLLKSSASIFLSCLGLFLLAYGIFTAIKPAFSKGKSNPLAGRILAGALEALRAGSPLFREPLLRSGVRFRGSKKSVKGRLCNPLS